jgi:glycine/D-amino acid oxidase-like deaminating enzyme
MDAEPIGTLAMSIDADERDELRAWVASAEAVGVEVERIDERVREIEPELSPEVLEAYLLHEGHRVDPLALTVCLGALARASGATIRHHSPARRLVERGERVTGVVTDDGVSGRRGVLAAGPWSPASHVRSASRCRSLGARLAHVHAGPVGCSGTGSRAGRRLIAGRQTALAEPGAPPVDARVRQRRRPATSPR